MQKSLNLLVINILCNNGYKILVVDFNGIQYWAVTQFDTNISGTEPTTFCSGKGIEITDYMNRESATDEKTVIANFEKNKEKQEILSFKFQKNIPWQWFTP